MEVIKRKIFNFYSIFRYLSLKNSMKKLEKEEFIKKAKEIHGNKYDYSKVNYMNNKKKVIIKCSIHGDFNKSPNMHLNNQGCPICGKISKSKNKTLTTKKFIEKAKEIHGDKYDYSLVKYKSYEEEVIIKCSLHGEFKQKPHSHILGSGCKKCGNVNSKTVNEIIKLSKLKHGDKYDYSKVEYVNAKTKIKIICPKHGEFEQLHNNHILGQGCPICKESKGEKAIRNFFKDNGLYFMSQKRFKECRDIKPLPFDFYLPNYNMCIEYDGEQHFKPTKRFGGIKGFNKIIKTDKIKTEFCLKNGVNLIRIKYNEDVIEKLKYVFSN
jgi:very-short-patch-repair endonuclease